ncbi:MAG: hypothetical protein V4708_17425 [Bacteroidota bacterium]
MKYAAKGPAKNAVVRYVPPSTVAKSNPVLTPNPAAAPSPGAQSKGWRTGKGWWKPMLSGLTAGAAAGVAQMPLVAAGGLPSIAPIFSAMKYGYNKHEEIKEKYNVPWMGRKKRAKKKVGKKASKKVSRKRK